MAIRKNLNPRQMDLQPEMRDILMRNGMQAHIIADGDGYQLAVQGHDSPLLTYNLTEKQMLVLTDWGNNSANKKAYNVFTSIIGKDFYMPRNLVHARNANGRVAMGLHGYRIGTGEYGRLGWSPEFLGWTPRMQDGYHLRRVGGQMFYAGAPMVAERPDRRLKPGELTSGGYGFYYKGQQQVAPQADVLQNLQAAWAASTSLGNRSFASFMSITAVDNANNKGIYMAIDDQLYNQIAATDYRKKNFNATETTVGEFTYPAYSNVKFNTPTYEADEIYMRLSEAYLLKAEAEARGGNSSAAQQTLYDLVSKRDSGYAKSSNTGEALLKEIFLQSRIELWGEGHEFFTNKRFNVGVDRTASSNHTHKLVKAAGKEFTYQIPLSIELNSNPYINAADQNPL